LERGRDENRHLYHWLEADWDLEAIGGRVYDGQDGQAHSGPRSVSAARDAFELSSYRDKVLVLDDVAVGNRLGLLHHEFILRTVGLRGSSSGLAGSWRGEPDGIEVNRDHSIDIVRLVGGHTLLVMLFEGEELMEHVMPTTDGHLLLDTEPNGGHCEVALLV